MTLVLTWLEKKGIAMAADSAITVTNTKSGRSHIHPQPAQKLHSVPYLNAGLSCWGAGRVTGLSTDIWLQQFISKHTNVASLGAFANSLATELNSAFGPNPDPSCARMGVHLAGFEDSAAGVNPSFFHIHDGPSQALAKRGINVNPAQFNPNHDVPPDLFDQITRGGAFITRNGDFQLYAAIFQQLEIFFHYLDKHHGIVIPSSVIIEDRADYLCFQVRTISEIYRLSNLVPGIGGEIRWMTIDLSGIRSAGVKFR